MFTTITAVRKTSRHRILFWRIGVFPLLLALLAMGFVGGGVGTKGAHASAQLAPAVSSQQADSAPATEMSNETATYIAWTGRNAAHNLNIMTYEPHNRVFGPAHILTETTPAGSGPSLLNWHDGLYIAWRGMDNRLNIGRYNPANPAHLTNKVTLNERSTNTPSIAGRYNLFTSWRGTDGHLNIISSSDGAHFGSKVTYPPLMRTSPTLVVSLSDMYVAWEEVGANSSVMITGYDQWHPTAPIYGITRLDANSQFPVSLVEGGGRTLAVRVAWKSIGDAHIHMGTFKDNSDLQSFQWPEDTTLYGPTLGLGGSTMSWTGTDAAHHINAI